MTYEYFQIKEKDMYVFNYLSQHNNTNFAIASIYIYYLNLKTQTKPNHGVFSVREIVHATLGELCELFNIEYCIDKNIKTDFIKINHKNIYFKGICTAFSTAIAKAPFFVLMQFTEGVKFYSLKSDAEVSYKYRQKLTKAIAERQKMIDEFRNNKSKYLAVPIDSPSSSVSSESDRLNLPKRITPLKTIAPKPVNQESLFNTLRMNHLSFNNYSSFSLFSFHPLKRKEQEPPQPSADETYMLKEKEVPIKRECNEPQSSMSIQYILS